VLWVQGTHVGSFWKCNSRPYWVFNDLSTWGATVAQR
jgi:hypothetical protein